MLQHITWSHYTACIILCMSSRRSSASHAESQAGQCVCVCRAAYTVQSIYCKNSMNLHLTKVIYSVINKLSGDPCLHSDPQFITIKVGCCCCQCGRLRGQIQEQIWAEMEPLWILVFTSQTSTKSVLLPHTDRRWQFPVTLTVGVCKPDMQLRDSSGNGRVTCTHTHTLSPWVSNESSLLSLFWRHTAITLN